MRPADLSSKTKEQNQWRILLVEGDADDYILIRDMLADARDGNFLLEWVSTYQAALNALKAPPFDAVLTSYEIGAHTGVEFIHEAVSSRYPAPFLLLSGRGHPEADIEALQAGAADYLHKDELQPSFLERSIRYAIERARLEKELDRSLQNRLEILDSIQDGFFAIDRDWRIIYMNHKSAQLMGFTVDELLGKNILETFPKIQNTLLEANYRKVMHERTPLKFEMRGVYLGQWYSISVYPAGEGISIYWQDITERKQAEEAMHEALDRAAWLARFPDENPNPVMRVAANGQVLYENSVAKKIPGWQSGDNHQISAPLFPLIQTAMAMGKELEWDVQLGDRFYSVSVMPFLPEQYANIYGRDVTQRKQAEQAQREAEERFRIALSNTSIAVFSTDRDLRYTWFYSTAMGTMPETFIGKKDDEILPLQNVAEFIALKRRALQERTNVREEIQLDLLSQEMILVVSIEPYFDNRGELIGVIGACFDITEQRRLELKNIEHQTQVEVQRRLMDYREKERQEIARDLHDGPVQDLSSTIFNIQCLKENFPDPATQLELEQIRSSIKRVVQDLRGMMNELRPPSLIRFGLGKAIQAHAEDWKDRFPQNEIILNFGENKQSLPEKESLALFRIYQEALTNITRHAQASKVWVRLKIKQQQVVLEIRDNGNGFIPTKDFSILAQNNHFGLAGMKERAEAMGGTFELSSTPGKGTVIKISIPLP